LDEQNRPICLCPLEGVIDVIGKKWSLLIVNAIGNHGKLRFNALMQQLGNISPKTLSDTLKELQAEGIVKRESFAEIPPRVEYSLTEDGLELRKAIIPLLHWAAPRHRCAGCGSHNKSIPAHKINQTDE
jgi:DNA-binding HxlR family transcriptional regulator